MTAAHFTEVLFIGYFTAAGVYSTLIFLITRNRPFLYYAALMDAAALAQLVFAGDLLGMAPGSERLLLFRLGSYTLFGIAQAAAALAFFAAWPVAPSYRRTVYAVLGLNLLMLAAQAALPADVPLQMAGHGLFLGLLLVCGACGRKQAKEGNESARFYVAGYAAAALGIVLSTLAHVLGWGNWPEYFFQIGITWQGALLALGLAGNYAKPRPAHGGEEPPFVRCAFDLGVEKRRGALRRPRRDPGRCARSQSVRSAVRARSIGHLAAAHCEHVLGLLPQQGGCVCAVRR